jgi:gamma-glutamylcyclotransferase (GGCT)/AIG2-like uncharacterized protein YtfP
MNILSNKDNLGHLAEALNHFNHAAVLQGNGTSILEVARTLADGLNKIQSEWFVARPELKLGEVAKFQETILEGLDFQARTIFLKSSQLRFLVELQPQIMNHDILQRCGYRPGALMESELFKKATDVHKNLRRAYDELQSSDSSDVEDRVIKRSAELLYIVRSNIAHGEKTAFGPNSEKRERDTRVCTVTVPLQLLLFDLLLDRPSCKLLVYGTLAPGEVNHSVIADVPGKWQDCRLQGEIGTSSDLPILSLHTSGKEMCAKFFMSDKLPDHWQRLDQFEGSSYWRSLVPVQTENGMAICNAYLGRMSH